jgi:hypothetical protein
METSLILLSSKSMQITVHSQLYDDRRAKARLPFKLES